MAHAESTCAPSLISPSSFGLSRAVRRALDTNDAWLPSVVRLALGAVLFPHGAQKALGWFGGPGLDGTVVFFADALHVPAALALLVVAAEFLGSIALVLGLATRVAAAGVVAVMIGAVALVHWPHGFFMNWFGTQAGEGFEFHVLAATLALVLIVDGGGRYSLDSVLVPHGPRR